MTACVRAQQRPRTCRCRRRLGGRTCRGEAGVHVGARRRGGRSYGHHLKLLVIPLPRLFFLPIMLFLRHLPAAVARRQRRRRGEGERNQTA
uniref:Uncharacterized protein n=1 Tax=Arundo donax TaxID=35708 RepID=A0A0A8Z6N6_ARUDO